MIIIHFRLFIITSVLQHPNGDEESVIESHSLSPDEVGWERGRETQRESL